MLGLGWHELLQFAEGVFLVTTGALIMLAVLWWLIERSNKDNQ